jgi:hypothetical protein
MSEQRDLYPAHDFTFYGCGVWPLGEEADAGVMVEGHGRRSLAAYSAHLRDTLGRYHGETETGEERWVVFHETCGCTPDEHAAHVAEADSDGWMDCDCQRYGLPPCRDTYAWTYERVAEGAPGALAVREVLW